MKTILFYLFLTVSFLSANAQTREFQNFKVLEDMYESKYFIIPLDFKQKFGLLQQEIREKHLEAHGAISPEFSPEETLRRRQRKREIDSITRVNLKKQGVIIKSDTMKQPDTTRYFTIWLRRGVVDLDTKKGIADPYPREWIEAATVWAKGLKEYGEKIDLSIYGLVNNTGEVLSVYFELNTVLLDYIREEDLQAVYDAVMKQSFYPDNFNFTRRDNRAIGDFIEKATDPELNMSGEERWAMAQEVMKKTKPCVYGVLNFFRMRWEKPQ